MSRISFKGLKVPAKEPSVSIADVQRIRRQRRLAQTEQEYSTVRSYIRDIAGELKSTPTTNTKLLRLSGFAVIVLGLVMGIVLVYAAFSIN